MGLSGRKTKQRIPADPRNLAWADDAAKFGTNYLSKFGWDSSKGLGASGDGRTSHIKVEQKLDMLGIGAAHRKDPDGIAWKQNKDFENLLKRLNEVNAVDEDNTPSKVEDDGEQAGKEGRNGEAEKKRKCDDETDGMAERKARKIRRKEREDTNSKKSKQAETGEVTKQAKDIPSEATATPAYIPRHRAHRARAIASKNMASKSTAAMSEILGIAPTPSTTSGSSTPSDKLTSPGEAPTLEKLTTSTKSVADYFRDKLLARSSAKSGTATPATPRTEYTAEAHEAPRGGLGSKLLLSSSPLHAPAHQKLAFDSPSVETPSKSTSVDISLTGPFHSTKKKKRTKEKDACLNDLAIPSNEVSVEGTKEAKKRAKSDKKACKEKKRSQANNENC